VRGYAEGAAEYIDGRRDAAAVIDPGADGITFADGLADHVFEGLVGGGRDGGGEGLAEHAFRRQGCVKQDAEANLAKALRLRRFVEHIEAGGDIRLERKMMQQPRAEGMNGLNLESARRLQRHSEQSPRERAPRRIRFNVRDSSDGGIERGVVER